MNESDKPTNDAAPTYDAPALLVDVFGRTDVGLVREHNEDNFLVADLSAGNRSIRPEVRNHKIGPKGSIFVVCDGMGGAAAGEVASQIAVDTIYDMMQQGDAADSEESLAQKLEKAICEAGRRILTAAKLNRAQRGMGTTVTAAALIGPRLIVGQVGDSRAYILRNRTLVQITKDQSLVQQLIDAKQMTEEEAKTFDKNNIILQALGTSEEVHVDVTSIVLKQGDRLVMCSDGLSGLVDNEMIRDVLYENRDPLEACRILTDKACEGGGHDNITAIVAAFTGDALAPAPPDDMVDPELVYSRFAFSRASETTVRKLRPDRPPGSRTPGAEVTQAVPAVPHDAPEPPPPRQVEQGRRSPVRLIAAGIAAISIAVISAVLVGGGGESEPTSESVPPVQAASAPPALTTAPAKTETEPKAQTPEPLPEVILPSNDAAAPVKQAVQDPEPTAEPSAPAVPVAESQGDDAAVATPEPSLSPTPEDAITKGKKERASHSNRKARSEKEETASAARNGGVKAPSTAPVEDDAEPRTSATAQQPTGTPKTEPPKSDAPKVSPPKTDTPGDTSDKSTGTEKKAPLKKESPVNIDENPFDP